MISWINDNAELQREETATTDIFIKEHCSFQHKKQQQPPLWSAQNVAGVDAIYMSDNIN